MFVPELEIHVQIDAPFTPATLSNIHSFVLRVDTLRKFFTSVNVRVLRRTITVSWNCICRYFYILFFGQANINQTMYNTTFSLEPLEPILFYRTTVSNGYEYAQCHT